MEFEGSNYFRFRLALSLISGKAITIKNIRKKNSHKKINKGEEIDDNEINEGLQEYEAKILKLIDKLCDDTIIKINENGDELYFKPGFLIGNVNDEVKISDLNNTFHCGNERSISYFLEFLIMIVPFFKNPVKLLLKGITDDQIDRTVYTCKIVCENFFKTFLNVNDDFLNITILKRGTKLDATGEVSFFMNNLKMINSFDMHDAGLVKKITGTIVCNKISMIFRNKIVNCAKKNLHNFTPYVSIEVEKEKKNNYTNKNNSQNNFMSLSLFAQTKNKCIYGTDLYVDKFMLQHVKDMLSCRTEDSLPMHLGGNKWDKGEMDENDEEKEEENIDDHNDKEEEDEGEKNGISLGNKTKHQLNNRGNSPFKDENKETNNISNIDASKDALKTLHDADIYERLGFFISLKLMNEIKGLSSIDSSYQWLPLLYMALANDTAVSKISLSALKPYSIVLIRLLRDFFSVVFDIQKVEKSQIEYSYLIKCVGIDYRNFSKKTF
ncbi:RNA 3'-terminal phosphate cyclase-like protein, putative [Plasmodium berghei]|uniref:RNA 3'-terminal phosphate cyclase-like protein, putative n=2 Tax=Plasmodium berghei TaxID=5821 RepID=A0A509ANY4_PLABA|nr:RNA 3'-terminal phosphate cyclase-like protein, putative [Plasmodium berghei ANKA]CXI97028.1 RNA 3'-terminal phosphate cyclase-like protein, putative [Plasmodium berghei]SCL97458.1 RNA 3'-terminal phosphate cyclase-like protein, putative [Plasmodium berghei]SCM16616.1 RNA 3'-terminal phosphate cyclase-like protein, putative [Plasmodium berghei]SCM18413.1 RNA 3'-terminal phosphate cyclase-like protein, putative [Plasmodium berghei]SCN27843.1 RNA 3'-terminal phosphate cyclase-like protein, pu|eukprot:XP_034423498.1 RNA 3'-terminal phosphate cyclase-like protein, putative [Plasmodium berghei ANKA]